MLCVLSYINVMSVVVEYVMGGVMCVCMCVCGGRGGTVGKG